MTFSILDWIVFLSYFILIIFLGKYFSREKATNTSEFFNAKNSMPAWAVTLSVLATSQSAATFLGAPDSSYRGNLTYLTSNLGGIIGVIVVAYLFIPKYYEYKCTTPYQFLEKRFGHKTKKHAAVLYLIGRVFASGSRVYLAAIAVSMVLFFSIEPIPIIVSVLVLMTIGLLYTYAGGIKSVIWTDVIQFGIYFGGAIVVVFLLMSKMPSWSMMIDAWKNPVESGISKLTLLDFRVGFTNPYAFSVLSSIAGAALTIGSLAMDQDMTQRLLTCKNKNDAMKSTIGYILLAIPVVLVFMTIGLLLYIFYQRSDLLGQQNTVNMNELPSSVQIFMYYILKEAPIGIRGLLTVGVCAAALSTINSGLNAMSSVWVQDILIPRHKKNNTAKSEEEYVRIGRKGMLYAAIALGAMAVLSYYWQQGTDLPLLNFALGVMVFSYAGLNGVYFTGVLTKRGNQTNNLIAMIVGFFITLFFQGFIWKPFFNAVGLQKIAENNLAFPWILVIGSIVSFIIAAMGTPEKNSSYKY